MRFRAWWKSPRVKQARHRLSDQQRLLFPLLRAIVEAWRFAILRLSRYEADGPLFDFIETGQPCIVSLWHQDVFPLMFQMSRHTPTWPSLFMVSHGRVGTSGSYLLNGWGIDCVAGRGPRRGIDAVEQLTRAVRDSARTVFIMADGSRGPAREARWGAVQLAQSTGLPIVPARAWATHLWILKGTWMQLALPLPWGRGVVVSGAPIRVGPGADRAELEKARVELEQALGNLVAEAEQRTEGGAVHPA